MNTVRPFARVRRALRRKAAIPDLLVQQIDYAIDGVKLARRACTERSGAQPLRSTMASIEHQGDDARADLVDGMAASLTTPLEREDIFRASRSIDDVLDNLRDFVRELAVWEVQAGEWVTQALDPVEEALVALREGAGERHLGRARDHCLRARKAAGGVRRCYQQGLTEIFAGELTMETLKQREVLRRLDVVGLRLTEATDALLDGLVKRSV